MSYKKLDITKDWKHIPCRICGILVPREEVKFLKTGGINDRLCKNCTASYNYGYWIKMKLRSFGKLGIDIPDHCTICGISFDTKNKRCVDHDHKTNKFRGFICLNCNHGLGCFKDNVDNLLKAISYLKIK